MKGKRGDRVVNTMKSSTRTRNRGGKVIKKKGIIQGPGDESFWNPKNETPEDRELRLKEFADTHTLILWAGNTRPYNHPDSGFKIL